MAEWGKYLKSAVANVEQQLDKVLLENQPGDLPRTSASRKEPAKSAGRRDLAERLRQAASGRNSSEEERRSFDSARGETSNVGEGKSLDKEEAPKEEVTKDEASGVPSSNEINNEQGPVAELITLDNFASAPDLGKVMTKARQLALAVQQDNTLELVDELEATQSQLDFYIENVTARLLSLNSKIAVLSQDKIAGSSQSERQVALLMEEGHRLSKRELELNLTVKKLRSDRNAALALGELANAKDKQIDQLKVSVEQLKAKLKEHEALVEHYRFLAEGAGGKTEDSRSSVADAKEHEEHTTAAEKGETAKSDAKFEVANRHFHEERRKWHELESNLLSRIAELEQSEEARSQNTAQLQQRLNEAQILAKSSRDHANSLMEELDTVKEASQQTETRLKAQINELTAELMLKKQLESTEITHQDENNTELPAAEKDIHEEEDSDDSRRPASPSVGQLTPLVGISPSPPPAPPRSPLPQIDSEQQSPRTGSILSKQQSFSGISLSQLDQVAVGPDGPFGGTLDESIHINNRPRHFDESFNVSAAQSSEIVDDSFSNLSLPRRESSMQGSELLQGSQLHLVRKMTLSLRRLENELSSAQKVAEISKSERDEAQAELVRLVDVQENLQRLEQAHKELQESHKDLQKQYDECKASIIDKDERIEELDADVRDLKEVYRDQIEALINEIEVLKK